VTDVYYLVDNNVLSRLTPQQRACSLMRDRCRIPSEVLFEARGFPDIDVLRGLEYPVSTGVLTQLCDVMRAVVPGDFKLVDLYNNRGNADPMLIATALDARQTASRTLFEETWRIVTDDLAVQAKAAEFGLSSMGYEDFCSILE
jgi:hypothetical protein